MIISKVEASTCRTCLSLLSAAVLVVASTAPSSLHAQQSALDQITPEYLIGSAVSLSNRKYPEIDKAIQRFRNNDGSGALEFLKQAKKKYPKLPPADVIFARMHLALAKSNTLAANAAHLLLERAVREYPDDPEAYLLLADLAFGGNRITEAQAIFELVEPIIEKFNENSKRKKNFEVRVLAGRAAVAERRTQWEQALHWLQKWVEADPESSVAQQRLGATLFRIGKPREAFEAFRKARKLNPNVPHPYILLGKLFYQKGDIEKAQKAFKKAYAENKNDPEIIQAYAEWLIQQGQLDEAQTLAAALRKQSPDSVSALMLDGIVALMLGQRDHAEQAMMKILSIDPSNSKATDLLAVLLIQSDDVSDQERALRYSQMNTERFPENTQAIITKAWVLYRLGRDSEFQETIKKIGRGKQIPADSAFLIAKIMLDQGKKDAAIRELERLVQQKSGFFIYRSEAKALLDKLKSE